MDGLVADALARSADQPWPIPDTGTIEGDLREITLAVFVGFADPQFSTTSTAVIKAALRSTQGSQALAAFFATRLAQAAQVVTRAIQRGELPRRTDPVEVIRIATAPLYYRPFITGEPVDEAVAERAAAAALAAAHAGVFDIDRWANLTR